jgi:flagellin-specific chaperone FliS
MTAKMNEVASLQEQLTELLAEGLREQLVAAREALEREQHVCEQLKKEYGDALANRRVVSQSCVYAR